MNDINIFVVEDKPLLAEALVFQLEKLGYGVCGLAASGEEALEKFAIIEPDLAFLDIDLGEGMNGIELAEKIRSGPAFPFIFLSGLSDEGILDRASKVGPAAFLKKPANAGRLKAAIQLAMHNLDGDIAANPSQTVPEEPAELIRQPNHFFIRWRGKYQKVGMAGIQYVEAAENCSVIHSGNESFTVSLRLKEVEERLNSPNMVRVHRSFVVNADHVEAIEENSILIGKKFIPIGGTYRDKLRELFNFL